MKDIKTYLIKESLTSKQEKDLEKWFLRYFGLESLDVDINDIEDDDYDIAMDLRMLVDDEERADEITQDCLNELKLNKSLEDDVKDYLIRTADYICY